VGSIRSPLWRKGGIVFGPKPRSYSYNLPKKVRKLALKMALSDKLASKRLYVLKEFGLEEIKTKKMVELLDLFEVEKAVIVTSDRDRTVELSARNIPGVKVLTQGGLNVYDLLKHEYLIIHEPAVEAMEERLK
jgi:large subunit ribosomal protein L4